jgi:GAF domain-containing protein
MTEPFDNLADTLRRNGVQAMLEQLNARVTHRYTAVYQVNDQLLRNLYLVDKQKQATPDMLAVVPMDDSFCQFALRDGSFATEDSAVDPRLAGHPAQGVVVSYTAVPIVDDQGEVVGTLCQFDLVRQELPPSEFALLEQVAKLLSAYVGSAVAP